MRGLLLLASFFLSAAAGAAEPRLVDAAGRPIAGVRVEMMVISDAESPLSRLLPTRSAAVTADDGVAPLRIPNAGDVQLIFDHPAFAPAVVKLFPERPLGEIRLEKGRLWRGRVVAAEESERGSQKPAATGTVCASGDFELKPSGETSTWRRCSTIQLGEMFLLAGLPSGALRIEAQVPGFLPLRATVDPLQQDTLSVERGVVLAGRVLDRLGRPVSDAVAKSSEGAEVSTDAEGRFAIAVPKLPVRLEVRALGFRQWIREVATADEIEIRLTPSEQVFGRLIGERNISIPEATVWIETASSEGARRSTQREIQTHDGDFILDLPGPGTYALRLRARGFRDLRIPPFHVDEHRVWPLGVLGLTEGAGARGVVVDAADGAPVQGALIELVPAGPLILQSVLQGVAFSDTSNEAGEFTVGGLNIGRYLVRVKRAGRAVDHRIVDLAGLDIVDLGTVVLHTGGAVHGRLLDRHSHPRPELQVRLFDPAAEMLEPYATATSDVEGRYRFPSIAPGRYRIQVKGARLLLAQEIEVPAAESELELDLRVGGVHARGLVTRGGRPVGGGMIRLTSTLDPSNKRGKIMVNARGTQLAYGLPESSLVAQIDRQGSFVADDVPIGLVWAAYLGARGERIVRSLIVPDEPEAVLSIELEGHLLKGRIVDGDSGLALAGFVQLSDVNGWSLPEVATEPDGWFQFEALAPGTYRLAARVSGYSADRPRDVSVNAETPFQELKLHRGEAGNIKIAFSRVDGSGAEGVPVTVFDPLGSLVASLTSQAFGERLFTGLPAGEYVVAWSDPLSGAGVSSPVQVGPFRKPLVEAVLDKGTSVVVVCPFRCAGRPLEQFAIYSSEGVEMTPMLSGVSPGLRFSENGEITVGRLRPGRYRFRLWVADRRWEREVTVGTGEARISFQ
jgi:hypothetical protein